MEKNGPERPNYGNWVSNKMIYVLAGLFLLTLGLGWVFPFFIILAAFFLLSCAYFAYARYLFSVEGKNVQGQIHELVLAHLAWDGQGRLLDIGCGNGPLTIKAAQEFPHADVVGIDYWGGLWEYSKEICEENARLEGVAGRTAFQKASASALPFGEGAFDAAISNLVFHEVKDIRDKRQAIKEALRVVKKGGAFAFQDLFLAEKIYGPMENLLEEIRSWGIEEVQIYRTNDSAFIPRVLKLPFMLGTMAIIYGRK